MVKDDFLGCLIVSLIYLLTLKAFLAEQQDKNAKRNIVSLECLKRKTWAQCETQKLGEKFK